MITLLLQVFRLLPFLVGGARQLALENLALHQQLAVYERTTARWTAQQLVDAFPEESAPAYLLRDREQVYGQRFRHRVQGMGIDEVLTAPQSPWQNPFAERRIASGAGLRTARAQGEDLERASEGPVTITKFLSVQTRSMSLAAMSIRLAHVAAA